jgi:hypothetical protein
MCLPEGLQIRWQFMKTNAENRGNAPRDSEDCESGLHIPKNIHSGPETTLDKARTELYMGLFEYCDRLLEERSCLRLLGPTLLDLSIDQLRPLQASHQNKLMECLDVEHVRAIADRANDKAANYHRRNGVLCLQRNAFHR